MKMVIVWGMEAVVGGNGDGRVVAMFDDNC